MARKEWLLVGAVLLLAALLFGQRGGLPGRGDVIDAPLTITPLDEGSLECRLGRSVGRYRCAFAGAETPVAPPPPSAERLAPYVTTDQVLYLIPGLFDVPAVRRFAAGIPGDRRFVARCRVRLLDTVDDAAVRFRPVDPWLPQRGRLWVVEPVSCSAE